MSERTSVARSYVNSEEDGERLLRGVRESRPSVLVVDDDQRNLMSLSEVLSPLGADIVQANSGSAALRLLMQREFTVILLDVRLSDMTGYEVADLVRHREKTRRTPIIFITAMDRDEAHIFRGYSAGAVDYVFKPVEPVILRAKVSVFIELHEQANEIRRQAELERKLLEENIKVRAARLDTELQLRSIEARQSVIISSLPIAFYEATPGNAGACRSFVPHNVTQLLGFSAEAFQSDATLWMQCIHPDDRAKAEEAFASVTGDVAYSVEYRFRKPDGHYRYIMDQGILSNADLNGKSNIYGTVLDVHDRRDLEQKLMHAQKIDALGHMTGGIAHDFGNMLMVTIAGLQRVLRTDDLDEQKTKNLELALEGANRCRDLIKRLLAFARNQPLSPQLIDVNQLIEGLSELLHRAVGGAIEVVMELQDGIWAVRADAGQLELAILNLAVNSKDAMPNGGRITLRTRNVDAAPVHRSSGGVCGDHVEIELVDTGTGMPRDVLERALEPYYTTKELGHGTGLGLSTTYGFVKQSGGEMTVDSERDRGTSVRICLPRSTASPAGDEPADVAGVPRPPSQNALLIMVVEDDAPVRSSMAGLLRDIGYRVVEAEDAQDALKLLEMEPTISLMLTDVLMPGSLNGYQLAEEVRRLHPDIKILFVSAHTGKKLAGITGAELGPMLRKPFLDHELAKAVSDLLG